MSKPIGINASRLQRKLHKDEAAFVEQWQSFNENNEAIRYILSSDNMLPPIPSQHDCVIAETMIQWLGSNVGMGFVLSVLEKLGYGVSKS